VRFCVVAAVAAAAFAAGCGSTQSRSSGKARSAGTIDALLSRPGRDVAAVAGDADFSPGEVRFSFLVLRPDARPVVRPTAHVWVAKGRHARPFARTTATLEPIGVPGVSERAAGGVSRIYVARFVVPRSGRYWVVAQPVGGRPIQAVSVIEVKRRSSSPGVGARAPRSQTPTLTSEHGRASRLTTRTPPDISLLRYSIAGSLAARKPFVVTFATPRFCESRTCGPVVDVVLHVQRQFAGSDIRFVHVEVYRDNDPARGYNRWMREWNLPSEPWTFLVGRDGRIKAKFEGPVSADELAAAVRRYLR
jgi:hypothetical protein